MPIAGARVRRPAAGHDNAGANMSRCLAGQIVHWGYMGIMDKKMETATVRYGLRIKVFWHARVRGDVRKMWPRCKLSISPS